MFKFVHIGWVSDSDGDLRCYPADCNLFPTAEECGGNNDDDDDDNDDDNDDDDDDVTCKKNTTCSRVLLRGCSIYDRSDPSLQVVGGCHTFKTIICS